MNTAADGDCRGAAPNRFGQSALACLLSPLLLAQGLWVKFRTPRLPEATGPREGAQGHGALLRLTALGDSIIAGVGVENSADALPAQLAAALAPRLRRTVQWTSQGRNGARTRDLLTWRIGSHWREADLLVISNGLNDVTGLTGLRSWLGRKAALYDRLRAIAPEALIAQLGIPPLRSFPALPQPLRWILGNRAARFDAALEGMIRNRPGIVHLPFRTRPDPGMFAPDGYHPGPAGVRRWAEALAGEIVQQLPDDRLPG